MGDTFTIPNEAMGDDVLLSFNLQLLITNTVRIKSKKPKSVFFIVIVLRIANPMIMPKDCKSFYEMLNRFYFSFTKLSDNKKGFFRDVVPGTQWHQ